MQAASLSPAHAFARSLAAAPIAMKAVAVLLGSLFIAASAQIVVPMVPVPMTMQTFAVLTIGMLFGARLGGLTVALYLVEGAMGLPVFHGGANLAVLMAKPFTLGFLVGFLVAAVIAGDLTRRLGGGLLAAVVAVVAGSAAIYALGLPWLAYMLGDAGKAIAGGAIPFLLGDTLKAVLVVALREVLGRVALFGPAR